MSTEIFQVLPGLPPYGPSARPFPVAFGRTGQEGYVVEFCPETSAAWIGNFRRGGGGYEGVCAHPNGNDTVVFASGSGYVVNPRTGELRDEILGPIGAVWQVRSPQGFVYDWQGLAFVRISEKGVYWHTRRISWDGFRDVKCSMQRIAGLAYLPSASDDECWSPFEVELATGRSLGGSYSLEDTMQWERLAEEQ